MWPHRVNKNMALHFDSIYTVFLVSFLSPFVGAFPAIRIPFSGACQLSSAKPSLYPEKGSVDKPKGIRWDRFLVLSGISEVWFPECLQPGLQSPPKNYCILWLPGTSATVSPRPKPEACSRRAGVAMGTSPNSSPDPSTVYFVQGREKSQNSLTGLACKDI